MDLDELRIIHHPDGYVSLIYKGQFICEFYEKKGMIDDYIKKYAHHTYIEHNLNN